MICFPKDLMHAASKTNVKCLLPATPPAPQRDQLLQIARRIDADEVQVGADVAAAARKRGLQPRLLPLHRRCRHLLRARMHVLLVGLLTNTEDGAGAGKYVLLRQPCHF